MSYPKGKQDLVCYSYEPWHYRYFGRDLAKQIHDSGVTPREYLWANFTQLDSTFQPAPSATPSAPPTEAPTPTASPTATPTLTSDSPSPDSSAGPTTPAGTPTGPGAALVVVTVLIVVTGIGLANALDRARRR